MTGFIDQGGRATAAMFEAAAAFAVTGSATAGDLCGKTVALGDHPQSIGAASARAGRNAADVPDAVRRHAAGRSMEGCGIEPK